MPLRDYAAETSARVAFIRDLLASAKATGIIFNNSGGKDCALAGILCKLACDDTVGVIMPCGSSRNYGSDKTDAELLAAQYGIESRVTDLTPAREALAAALGESGAALSGAAVSNIAPRLRMTAAYAIAASENRLFAGTGNRSEIYMGYFTKWGDGAYDFNPIADLTVTEVREFLRHLGAPACIIDKAPSAGLFEGQTDEADMGVTYDAIDEFILRGVASDRDRAIIGRYHANTAHKRRDPARYGV